MKKLIRQTLTFSLAGYIELAANMNS